MREYRLAIEVFHGERGVARFELAPLSADELLKDGWRLEAELARYRYHAAILQILKAFEFLKGSIRADIAKAEAALPPKAE